MKFYTGIGSRETPDDICSKMRMSALTLAMAGFTVRSGGAEKADEAFELGCDDAGGSKEIYLPWKGFRNNSSPLHAEPSPEVIRIATQFHPRGNRLKRSHLLLHARNVPQVLGYDLQTPSSFVICWTKDGGPTGGTGQALRIASHYDIPIFNLYHAHHIEALDELISRL